MSFINFVKKHSRLLVVVATLALAGGGYVGYQWYTTAYEDWRPISVAPDEVRGRGVILRKLKESFFIDFHNMFSRDVRQNIEFPEYIDLDYTIRFLKYEMERDRTGKQLMYCIFDAKENKLIGTLEIREKNDKDPGQFGCWLNERYRGGGRIQEAIKLITNIYFRLTDVPLFTAHVRLWNKRSYRALLKAGFTDTGKFYYEDGKPTRYLLEFRRKK
jgi:RimJ/RimL family protein N-acetyltransferase